jgi:hypothetical protein
MIAPTARLRKGRIRASQLTMETWARDFGRNRAIDAVTGSLA